MNSVVAGTWKTVLLYGNFVTQTTLKLEWNQQVAEKLINVVAGTGKIVLLHGKHCYSKLHWN